MLDRTFIRINEMIFLIDGINVGINGEFILSKKTKIKANGAFVTEREERGSTNERSEETTKLPQGAYEALASATRAPLGAFAEPAGVYEYSREMPEGPAEAYGAFASAREESENATENVEAHTNGLDVLLADVEAHQDRPEVLEVL